MEIRHRILEFNDSPRMICCGAMRIPALLAVLGLHRLVQYTIWEHRSWPQSPREILPTRHSADSHSVSSWSDYRGLAQCTVLLL